MADYYADLAHVARVRAKDFVAALEPNTQAFWRRMPARWTAMMALVGEGEPQSTVSTRLKILRRAHFVERKVEGRVRYYRPKLNVVHIGRVMRPKKAVGNLEVKRDA
jgi:DNA-binding transcriptional ArsR family regulator